MPRTPGQIAFEAFHGYSAIGDEWPADDKIVIKWEAAGAAVASAERAACLEVCKVLVALNKPEVGEANGRNSDIAFGQVSAAEHLAGEIMARSR